MESIRVLFVCIHNSARSQMAEAFLSKYSDRFVVESAGIEPGVLNPVVVAAMQEIGIDISGNVTKDVFGFIKEGRKFDYVITVCDETSAERCPIFPGVTERLHWGFPDPSALTGEWDVKLAAVRKIRDQIADTVQRWAATIN